MNLRGEIRPELWDAIAQQYDVENYSDAILSALHYLRDILRNAADVDGDGIALAGQALGGSPPRLRVNKYETESERDEQRGFEQLVRGLYQGIRNPRTHEKINDKKETADAIIVFVNYVVGVVSKASGPFVLEEWLARVFDPDFVRTQRYAQLLAGEVPTKRYIEVLIAIYRRKSLGNGRNLELVVQELIKRAGEDKIDEFLSCVSTELRTTSDEAAIRLTMHMLPVNLWPRIDEAARLRIEHKLIRSIAEGKVNYAGQAVSGALGTWARDFARVFTMRNQLYQTLLTKLKKDEEERGYMVQYFWAALPHTFEPPADEYTRDAWISAICAAVTDGSSAVREKLQEGLYYFPSKWRSRMEGELKPLQDEDPDFFNSLFGSEGEDIPF